MEPLTLIVIQASTGDFVKGTTQSFPDNALAKVTDTQTTTDVVFERMTKANIPNADVVVLSNEIVCEIIHDRGRAATALADYLKAHFEYVTVVRLLGNHTLTDPDLVSQAIGAFDHLPASTKLTHKLGPNVCGFGQNIEVFNADAFLEQFAKITDDSQRQRLEEHITPLFPSADDIPVINQATAEVFKQANFYPYVSPLPGFVQGRTLENVKALLGHHEENKLPYDIKTVWASWQKLGLSIPKWEWSDPKFSPKSFADVRVALARGITTIHSPDIPFSIEK